MPSLSPSHPEELLCTVASLRRDTVPVHFPLLNPNRTEGLAYEAHRFIQLMVPKGGKSKTEQGDLPGACRGHHRVRLSSMLTWPSSHLQTDP